MIVLRKVCSYTLKQDCFEQRCVDIPKDRIALYDCSERGVFIAPRTGLLCMIVLGCCCGMQ